MNNAFNSQVLAEKLSKLNNSQQSIETLSHWCIFHRKKARQVVETWQKLFNSSSKEKRVPFMYLANDILQNSRRNGSEFVNEFWKVLPRVLKNVSDSGDDHGKNVVMRLVDIWDERKVFGSRGRVLKDEILGKDPSTSLDNNDKASQSIKILKKDSSSLRIKLTIGCLPEKIMSAFHSVHDEHFNEDTIINKCKTAAHHVGQMEKDVDACIQGNTQVSPLISQLQEEETVLKQCTKQLEKLEANRTALISHLKEALLEQESKLELIRDQLHIAETESEHMNSLRQKLFPAAVGCSRSSPIITTVSGETMNEEQHLSNRVSNTSMQQPAQPVTSFASSLPTAEEQHKKTAAEVAAKLAAMTSSAEVLSSVFSSLVAQQAASRSTGLDSGSLTGTSPIFPMEKRPRHEKPVQNFDTGNGYLGIPPQQLPPVPSIPSQSPVGSLQQMSQATPPQPPFPPPLPSLLPPLPTSVQQYVQTSGGMSGVVPYGYNNGGSTLPPPPPPPTHVLMSLPRLNATHPQQSALQQHPPLLPPPPPPQQQQQQVVTSGFYSSPVGFFGQPPTTAVPRQ